MDLIASILNRDQVEILPADPDSPDARACLDAYFTELAARVSGIGPGKFTDPDAEAYRPPRGRMLLAWSDELPIGCVSLRLLDGKTAEVKRLWVAGHARGQGLSRRLMQAIEAEARGMGMTSLKLDTHSALTEAVSLYRASGWRDIPPYTGLPADTWLAKVL
ncbi:MAG: GNAT family N-acetyltransferase [Tabrizicola sp.]|nr:GNAT family N-acetyltransferase [Tabrizicola sp.]